MEGFTCYRKTQEIDFSDLDLFAITGPTGSGKSSLVDAIIFGLFGRVPRLNLEVSNLVSQGLNRASVLLEFQIANQQYKIVRTLHTQKNSQAILDILEDNKWRAVASGVRQANSQLSQILGLDYEAFTRCIVLPQGEFQNFLHDSKSRQDILTRLLNLEILGEMQKEAHQRHEQTKERIQNIQQRLGQEFTGVTTNTLQDIRQQHYQAQDKISQLQHQLETNQEQYRNEQEIWELVQQIQITQKQYQELVPLTPQIDELEQKIILTKKIQPAQAQLEQYQVLKTKLAKLQDKQLSANQRHQQLQTEISAYELIWKEAVANYEKLPELEKRLEQLQIVRIDLSKSISLQQSQLQQKICLDDLNQRIQESKKCQQETLQKYKTIRQQFEEVEKNVVEIQTAKSQLQKFQTAEPLLQQLREGYMECQRKAQILKQAKSVKEERQQNLTKITAELQACSGQLRELTSELGQLGDRAQLEKRWQQTEEARQIQERIQYHIQQQQEATTRWQQADQAVQKIAANLQQAKQTLEQHQQQIQKLLHNFQEQEDCIQKINAELPLYQNSQTQLQTLQNQIVNLQAKLQQYQQEIKDQQRSIQQNQQEKQRLLEQYQQHKRDWMKIYTEDVKRNLRDGLQIGCNCPLCDQKIIQIPAVSATANQNLLPEIQATIDKEQQRIKILERSITESETKLQQIQTNIANINLELQQITEEKTKIQTILDQIVAKLKMWCQDNNPVRKIADLKDQCNQLQKQIKLIESYILQSTTQIHEQTILLDETTKRRQEYANAIQSQKQYEQEYQAKLPSWLADVKLDIVRQQLQQELVKMQAVLQKYAETEKILAEFTFKQDLANKQVVEAENQERNFQAEVDQTVANYEQKQEQARHQVQLQVVTIGQALSEGLKQYRAKSSELEKLQAQQNEIQQQLNQVELVLARNETSLHELSQNCIAREKELAKINQDLQTLESDIEQKTGGQPVEAMINQIKQQRQDSDNQYHQAQERKIALEQAYTSLSKELQLLKDNLNTTQEEYDKVYASLNEISQQLQITNFHDLVAMRFDVDKIPLWEQKVMLHRLQLRELENRVQLQQQKLANRSASEESLQAIQKTVEETKKQIHQYTEECGRLQQQIQQTEQLMLKMGELQVELTQIQKNEGIQKQLAWDLRANYFPSFVMEKALQTLAEDASMQLDILSESRYAFSVNTREISIIDHWNHDEIRPAKTLSGGETFLASLALALALSDRIYQLGQHSGGTATLESLFLDEGFGSLDEEYLDVVVKALVNLQGTGRMIGIISHLPVLNNYLPARLVVHKTREGSSVEKVRN